MAHGYAKIMRGPEHFAEILSALKVPAPHLLSWLTILVEVMGGLAVLLGAFVPIVAVPMAAILVVATLTVHLQNGFSSIKLLSVTASGAHFGQPGYETDLLYLSCLAVLAFAGSGPLSIEAWLRRAQEAGGHDERTSVAQVGCVAGAEGPANAPVSSRRNPFGTPEKGGCNYETTPSNR